MLSLLSQLNRPFSFSLSYDYETYAPPSTNGTGGLSFIGMQRCLDCGSSPVADLYSRWQAQGWESASLHRFFSPVLSQLFLPPCSRVLLERT